MLPEEKYDDCSGQNSSTCKWVKPAKTSLGVKIRNSMAGVNLISNSNNVVRLFLQLLDQFSPSWLQADSYHGEAQTTSVSFIHHSLAQKFQWTENSFLLKSLIADLDQPDFKHSSLFIHFLWTWIDQLGSHELRTGHKWFPQGKDASDVQML